MKILLSAYACEPGLGSEAAVGWGWATHLSPKHEVHVITRESNRARIENELSINPTENLYFHYFDLPQWARRWKKGNRGVHLYYLFWQLGAYKLAKKLHQTEHFTIAHHVTFVSMRFPSFMGRLGIPFIFGPVAGGERAPLKLWWSFNWKARFKELLRTASILWLKQSFLIRQTLNSADSILTTSQQTSSLVSSQQSDKITELLGIALNNNELSELKNNAKRTSPDKHEFRVFYAGRFLHWKGMEFGLHAFSRLCKDIENASLTMIGDGPELDHWKNISNDLGISDRVQWIEQMSRADFLESIRQFDVLLFPSLHDSGGMVVLESMAAGTPAICLDIGGPAILINETSGIKVKGDSRNTIINELYKALLELATHTDKKDEMGKNAIRRVHELFLWDQKIMSIEKIYESAVRNHETTKQE